MQHPNLLNPEVQEITTAGRVEPGENHTAATTNAFNTSLETLCLGNTSWIPENAHEGPEKEWSVFLLCGLEMKG